MYIFLLQVLTSSKQLNKSRVTRVSLTRRSNVERLAVSVGELYLPAAQRETLPGSATVQGESQHAQFWMTGLELTCTSAQQEDDSRAIASLAIS